MVTLKVVLSDFMKDPEFAKVWWRLKAQDRRLCKYRRGPVYRHKTYKRMRNI